MVVIGITGGMGAGKSTVARHLGEMGIPVFNADAAVRRLQEPGMPGAFYLEYLFGGQFFHNGELNRKELADYLFTHPEHREAVQNLLFPLVRLQLEKEMKEARANGAPAFIIDAPLLIESGIQTLCDAVWVVTAPLEQRILRLQARTGLSREDILLRINSQITDEQRKASAHALIDNTRLEIALQQAQELYAALLQE